MIVGDAADKPGSGARRPDRASLDSLVAAEAKRIVSEAQIHADPDRIAAGWERRFVADASRVEEMTNLYRKLGFEVVADPILPQLFEGDCEDCQLLVYLQFRMIYTRKRQA